MKKLTYLFTIVSSVILNAQTIKVLNIKNLPVEKVSAYFNDKKIGESDVNGFIKLAYQEGKDSIYFIKNGFYNEKISVKNIPKELRLDSLKTYDIEAVVIKNLSAKDLIEKAIAAGKNGNLYGIVGNVSIYDELKSTKKLFYKVENNFFYKPKVGRFIENKNNVVKNFEGIEDVQYGVRNISKILDQNNQKFALFGFTIPNIAYVTGRAIPQLIKILERVDDYNYIVKKGDGKIIIEFSPNKKLNDKLYIGRLIIDSEDFGIYEGLFNLIPNINNNTKTYINRDKKTKAEFGILQEKYIFQNDKVNGKYKFKFSNYNLIFKGLDGNIKNELFFDNYDLKAIDFLNVETAVPFNFNTYEFKN